MGATAVGVVLAGKGMVPEVEISVGVCLVGCRGLLIWSG
jgi:hypothetical protein